MNVKVDFHKTIGQIKPMHGVGQPPIIGTNFGMFRYLKEAGIPFSRLHDVGGWFGGNLWADVPNIFRDFSADATKEENYDFTFTDQLITALIENGVEPFFRLGVTIENFAELKAYRIYPPTDNEKWAVICEHIIRHYTEGWANGFRYKIRYWEIWNEPDNYEDPYENQMWRGTKEEYYALYGVVSKHLKTCFPHLKIGGYASCGFYALTKTFVAGAKSSPRFEYFIEFFDGFLEHIRRENCPLDFFSWHSYDGIENNKVYATYARKRLDEAGYTETETTCNEWNHDETRARGTKRHAALVAGMMLAFQDTPLDSAMFYDARIGVSVYGSLFNPLTGEPFPAYYAFVAFNKLYELGDQVCVECSEEGVYAVGARNETEGYLMISNTTEKDLTLSIEAIEAGARAAEYRLITERGFESITELPAVLEKESVLLVQFMIQ